VFLDVIGIKDPQNVNIVDRLNEFMDNEARSCSMENFWF